MPKRFYLASKFTDSKLEISLLAAIAARPEVYWEIVDLLSPEILTESRQTFESLVMAIEEARPLPEILGEPCCNPLETARRLAELYQKRLLADLVQNFLEDLHGESPISSLMTGLEENVSRVQQAVRELRAGQIISFPDLIPEILKEIAKRRLAVKEHGTASVGLPTGIPKLDRLLGGLQAGLHLLAAEPGQGKTTFILQIATNVAQFNYPVLFVSFEEALSKLALKALCQQSGLEMKKFTDGYGEPAELEEISTVWGPRLDHLYLVEGNAKLTISQVKAKALQVMARRKSNQCLIVVDYLQRWAAARRDFSDFRHVVSSLVSELRELALRLDSPVVAISSQNRSGQGTALLTSLKESGDLEYSADTALFMVENQERCARPPTRAIDLKIEKNRYGDKGKVNLIFKPEVGIFREEAIV